MKILLISIIYPFYGVLSYFKENKDQHFSFPLLVFFVFFGLFFVVPETGDASRHFITFQLYIDMSWGQFVKEVIEVISLKSRNHTDIYIISSNYFVSRFSSSPSFYFGFQALVYGTVFIYLFKLILKNVDYKWDLISGLIFLTLFLVLSIAKIQYVRFYLAVMFFLYGCFLFLLENRKYFWLYFIFAILVHISLLIPASLFFVFIGFRNNLTLWFSIAILAYFSSSFMSHYSDNILTLSSDFASESSVNNLAKGYVGNEDYILERSNRFETRNWFTKYSIYMGNALSIALIFIFVLFKFDKINLNKKLIYIFTFSLFIFSLAQFGYAFASVGERFMQIFIFSGIYFLYLLYPYLTEKLKKMLFIPLFPFLLLFTAMALREVIVVANLFTLIGSPIYIPFVIQDPISIYDFMF
ncbi:hypothetical protein P872_09250 [Rhodonellum psychrophilum GCM71 = DSM 17998]|uniref:EpsG family protein n=2 Tax=Rhodonellum TaxID=336827 RepID=U5BY20_9BACT|nr:MULTISPECIES: EpsG family protein [Rhodonellum]ERM81531.1 hypothetical protein P872_09250 [Rhodonellum psychrophilum GCM71 = DSM 17998]SDZ40633.1 EpsG family protein [Rhodonellum ikkaensis]